MRGQLQTAPLLLRRCLPSDAANVRELAGDPEVARTTLNIPHPYEAGMAEAWIAHLEAAWTRGTKFGYAIVEAKTGDLAGTCTLLHDADHARAELVYWIGKRFWNRGYATQAATVLVAEGFRSLGLERIHAAHFASNPASGRVMEKIGMRQEGVLRRHVQRLGVFHDLVQYGMLREEPPNRTSSAI